MRRETSNDKRFRVGDRIVLRLGQRRVIARVVEDRGLIGKGGRRLLRVQRTGRGELAQQVYEVPAQEVSPAR